MSSGKKFRPRKRKTPRTRTNSKRTRKSKADRPAAARTRSTEAASPRSPIAYLSLGSNVGNRRDHLTRALAEISRRARVESVSSFYSTGPVGHADQRRFWNAVVAIRWPGSPASLLAALKEVERRGGRVPTFRNGPREIDVDILDLRGLVRTGRDPILPHPRMAGRRFVLAPLEATRMVGSGPRPVARHGPDWNPHACLRRRCP